MKIKSIDSINKVRSDDNKSFKEEYNLYIEVLIDTTKIKLFEFPCTKRHEMRLDLVSTDVYDTNEYVDVLCNLNNLVNVFNVKEGDIILFIEQENIDNVSSSTSVIENIKDQLKTANKGKSFKIDNNRKADITKRKETEKNKAYLPPNILDSNKKNLNESNGVISLKPNF